jgi:hypothetical protein
MGDRLVSSVMLPAGSGLLDGRRNSLLESAQDATLLSLSMLEIQGQTIAPA